MTSSHDDVQETAVATDLFESRSNNLFQQVVSMQTSLRQLPAAAPRANPSGNRFVQTRQTLFSAKKTALQHEANMNLFRTVRPNIVQSIRAFRIHDLADEAARLNQHFLYANCANARTKGEVLETIANAFLFQHHFGKNFDALFDCLTDMLAEAGTQPGFVIVLEGLPVAAKFDKEARETLLDVFREAAEFWGERKVAFRVFYSFA